MNARVTINAHDFDAASAAEAPYMLHTPVHNALPAPAQFDAVAQLIKTVLNVPAVSVALHGAPANAENGVYRSFLEIPLINNNEVVGSLRALDTEERKFSDRDCELLEGFAKLVVDQMELWAEASRDVLTGTMTRRAFLDTLRKSFAARSRSQTKATLVLFDLDHFKMVNDTWGHAAGDAVLKTVARTVQRELRVEDSFGRVGGEEFAILIANADAAAATVIAERVRKAIARASIPGHPQIKITASFGVAEATNAVLDADDWSERADAQLYAAKDNGRDRVNTEAAASPRVAMVN
ncbi:sensor domain-containing diguanylate cyclase [Pararhodobacter oceanensis]|uniref:diguanylate cyclase n=1 Tax=Pararhodobacter oceanensis TaxID=2172121 RepID=A0A2T8HYG8_9RHOB|nr:sensor domain-containing diguanylate cyclase [Pararhodobacter oceanensis]PVH30490.1 sensor domain-containing diguanylate cyclase [Pararhodobacter oceanensis]